MSSPSFLFLKPKSCSHCLSQIPCLSHQRRHELLVLGKTRKGGNLGSRDEEIEFTQKAEPQQRCPQVGFGDRKNAEPERAWARERRLTRSRLGSQRPRRRLQCQAVLASGYVLTSGPVSAGRTEAAAPQAGKGPQTRVGGSHVQLPQSTIRPLPQEALWSSDGEARNSES